MLLRHIYLFLAIYKEYKAFLALYALAISVDDIAVKRFMAILN
jgi:hypothetical protein